MNEKEIRRGFLKEKMAGYRVDPPESVWNSISAQMGGRSRRGWVIIAFSAAAGIALAVTLGITYFGKWEGRNLQLSEMATDPAEPGAMQESGQFAEPGALQEPGQFAEPDALHESGHADAASRSADRDGAISGKPSESGKPIESMESSESQIAAGPPRQSGRASVVAEGEGNRIAVQETGMEDVSTSPTGSEEIAMREVRMPEEDREVRMSEEDREVRMPGEDEPPVPGMEEGDPLTELTDVPEDELALEQGEWAGGQEEKDPRWIIGAALSPLYSFRDAEAGAVSNAGDFESGLIAYAGGVHVSYRAARRVAIESGVFFNKMGVSIGAPGLRVFDTSMEFAPLYGASERGGWKAVSNSIGNIVSNKGDIYVNNYKLYGNSDALEITDQANTPSVTADEGIRQHLDYLELPLNVRYTVVDRTFELQLVGGMSTNFLLNNYITMETPEGTEEVGYLTNIRNVNYSGNAGVGMIYHLHRQVSLRLEPRFRYFLNSVNDASLPATRPYSLGLYTGITYTF